MATEPDGYVDLYLLPVPRDRLDEYRAQATTFGEVALQHGALAYREFLADDPGEAFAAMAVREGDVLTAAVAEFTSREHRDEVMRRVLEDPRVTGLMEGDPLADLEQMRYGGFRTIVRPAA
jgi:uncharacterized protein YbaA (DUF1428 family)